MKRALRLFVHLIQLKSVTLALWVDAYENHKTTHGK